MGTNSLFRMIAVRSARPGGIEGAIDLSRSMETDFQLGLAKAKSSNDAQGQCRRFVSGPSYWGNDQHAAMLSALVNAEAAVARADDPVPPKAIEDYAETLEPGLRNQFRNADALFPTLADSFIAASFAGTVGSAQRRRLQTGLRVANIVRQAAAGRPVPRPLVRAPVVLPSLPSQNQTANPIRPAGIADLLVVEQELLGYKRSEVAYVENVMASEVRSRTHRKLDRTSSTYSSERESTTTSTRDLQSTTRSELSSETSRALSEEMSLALGTSVSAKYGPVLSVDASADFSYGTAREEAASSASSFAQEVVDRSVSSLSERKLESSSVTTLAETEETNAHAFENNRAGTEHIIGVYRWLDQRWRAQIMNYGRRLMLEFHVPEPAGMWHWAQNKRGEVRIDTPEPPHLAIAPDEISENASSANYWMNLAERFRAGDLEPPPAAQIKIATSLAIAETAHGTLGDSDYNVKTQQASMTVPEGYAAIYVRASSTKHTFIKDRNDNPARFEVQVASAELNMLDGSDEREMSEVRGTVPITAFLFDIVAATIGLRVTCQRTPEAFAAWQSATWTKLKQANDKARDAWTAELGAAVNAVQALRVELSSGQKREIERTELKRGSLNLLLWNGFDQFDPIRPAGAPGTKPEIDVAVALEYGDYLSFFEQSFEWEQMTYLFYPYFWGDKGDWDERLLETDPDQAFEAFLKAGSSRVQVPVRPGFERALIYFLQTGQTWGGRDTPLVDSPLYVPIAAEIAEALDKTLDEALPYGEPWEFLVPTSLVALDADASIIDAA
ncbi:MAG: hypothetical protein HZB40_16030 [Rhodocyclales bacterium]|nr:hypothetical protein [Rhodocyclales bacterium]